jgi:hypothetical protein
MPCYDNDACSARRSAQDLTFRTESEQSGALQIKTINKLLRDLRDEGAIISMGDWTSDAPPENGSLPYGYARASGANRGGGRGGRAWHRGNEAWRRESWRGCGGNTAE